MSPVFLVGYLLGGLMIGLGTAILTGFFEGGEMMSEPIVRTVFGAVLILYGIYRIVMTNQARRRGLHR